MTNLVQGGQGKCMGQLSQLLISKSILLIAPLGLFNFNLKGKAYDHNVNHLNIFGIDYPKCISKRNKEYQILPLPAPLGVPHEYLNLITGYPIAVNTSF